MVVFVPFVLWVLFGVDEEDDYDLDCREAATSSGRSPGRSLHSYQSTFAQNGKKYFARVDLARKLQGETHVGNRANFLEILHGCGFSRLGVKIR